MYILFCVNKTKSCAKCFEKREQFVLPFIKDNKDRFYLAPVDANIEMIRSSCIDADRFSGYLDDIRGKVVVFADACYSGALLQGRRSVSSLDMQKVVSEMNRAKPGRYIYASSEDDTVSNELPEWENGAFTKALIEAFEGKAKAEGQKALTTVELMNFLRKRMKEIIKGDNNRKQIPGFDGWNEEFPLFTY